MIIIFKSLVFAVTGAYLWVTLKALEKEIWENSGIPLSVIFEMIKNLLIDLVLILGLMAFLYYTIVLPL